MLGLVKAPASVIEPLTGLLIIRGGGPCSRRSAVGPVGDHVCVFKLVHGLEFGCTESAAIARPRSHDLPRFTRVHWVPGNAGLGALVGSLTGAVAGGLTSRNQAYAGRSPFCF